MVVEVEVGEGQVLLQEGVKGEVVLEEEAEAGVEQQVVEQVTNSYKLMMPSSAKPQLQPQLVAAALAG